ncbi:MAG: hypothetical protein NT130_04550 [Candidatus Micrarchaeota archaeon]|nr:hypothetical protein [Candidatus Micrarchaeota archaeon]
MDIQLSEEQKNKIKELFTKYLQWDKKEYEIQDHRKHQKFLQDKLSPQNIEKMTKDDFAEIYKKLWASKTWTNKDYKVNEVVKDNGLEKIKEELKKLLYNSESIEARIDSFGIKGLGASSWSEILNMVFPEKFCLWNNKPKTVLPFLDVKLLPDRLYRYSLTEGKDYSECTSVISLFKDELERLGGEKNDFVDVDCFFWFIFTEIIPKEKPEEVPEKKIPEIKGSKEEIKEHADAQYILLSLGNLLGHPTYTAHPSLESHGKRLGGIASMKEVPPIASERILSTISNIDVIWFDISGENPIACFEVEHTTDITKGLLRIYQVRHYQASFVIVAPSDSRKKFEIEVSKDPFKQIRNRYHFVSYDELTKFNEAANEYYKLKLKIFGETGGEV